MFKASVRPRGEFDFHRTAHVAASLAITVALLAMTHQAAAQGNIFQRNNKSSRTESHQVQLASPPRDLQRALSNAQRDLDNSRYSEAVEALSDVLNMPGAQDYFLRGDGDTVRSSLKREAQRLLGSMPSDGREIYELQVGRDAQRQLDTAIEQHDIAAVADVGRQYFHTRAGYDATYLLGRYYLDRSQPVAAMLCLRRLREASMARERFEPELSFLYAICQRKTRDQASAMETLQLLIESYAGATLQVAGELIQLPQDDSQLRPLMDRLLGETFPQLQFTVSDWAFAGGETGRNAQVDGGMPMTRMEWRVPANEFDVDAQAVSEIQRQYRESGVTAIPTLNPIGVGETILVRTPQLTYGVDLSTGLRRWPFPWDAAEESKPLTSEESRDGQGKALLRQFTWEDSVYSQMSTDGKRLFVIRDLQVARGPLSNDLNVWMRGMGSRELPVSMNRLMAVELASEGKTLWTAGGRDSDDRALAEAFFLGAPLPLENRLYAIAEMRDEIKLVVLDAATGRLQWSQQLVQVEPPFTLHFDQTRRLSGCTPSYSDGVLVCPTSSGAVVGVDLTTRSLLWGYRYHRSSFKGLDNAAINMMRGLANLALPGKRWADSMARIADGCVVVTPVESDKLHCLDLVTGERKWQPKSRRNGIYVAGINQGTIVIVERNSVQGMRLADGKKAWRTQLDTPSDHVAGRGYIADDALFLPTTRPEIIKFDLQDGRIVESVPMKHALGNLICHGNYVISQGIDGIRAYRLRDQTRVLVNQRLAANPDDIEALEDHATLLVSDGKTEEAIGVLRRLMNQQLPPDMLLSVKAQQVDLLLRLLEEDFEKHRELADEVEPMLMATEEFKQFYRIMAGHLMLAADHGEAMDQFLKLVEIIIQGSKTGTPIQLVPGGEENLRVREEVWVGSQMVKALAALDATEAATFNARLSDLVAQAESVNDIEALAVWASCLGRTPAGNQARLALALHAGRTGRILQADLILGALTDQPQVGGEATARLAALMAAEGHRREAAQLYRTLATRYADETVLADKTGTELADEYYEMTGLPPTGHPSPWPTGKIEASALQGSGDPMLYRAHHPIRLMEARGTWPPGTQLAYDMSLREIRVLDPNGQTAARVALSKQTQMHRLQYGNGLLRAKAYGHLVVATVGDQLVAVDTISDVRQAADRVLWQTSDALDVTGNASSPYRIGNNFRTTSKPVPFSDSEAIVRVTINGHRSEQIACVGPTFVCYLRRGELKCVHPLTGEPIWVRSQIASDADVFGDDEFIFVTNGKSKTATVLDTQTGLEVGQRDTPHPDRHWRYLGRQILTWDGISSFGLPRSIRMQDVISGENTWTQPVAKNTKAFVIDGEELAIFEPNGDFKILRLRDGQEVIHVEDLEEEQALQGIYVIGSSQRYVLVTNNKTDKRVQQLRRAGIQAHAPSFSGSAAPRVTGHVYAFDRQTGKMAWSGPAAVADVFFPPSQPREAPVLAFVRNVSRSATSDGRNRTARRVRATNSASLFCIDLRDGSVAYANKALDQAQVFRMMASPNEQTVSIQLRTNGRRGTGVLLTLTDQPRPAGQPAVFPPLELGTPAPQEPKEKNDKPS